MRDMHGYTVCYIVVDRKRRTPQGGWWRVATFREERNAHAFVAERERDEARAELARLRAKVAAMQLVIDGSYHGDVGKFCAGVNAAIDLEALAGKEE